MENTSRSLNHDLDKGMVEGKYKDTRKGWGGVVEPTTEQTRKHLHSDRYDIVEVHPKITPDGRATYAD